MEVQPNPQLANPERDALYNYDEAGQKDVNSRKPWNKDPNFFKTVRIGAEALVKMVMHARSGGTLEVMGLMQGYIDGATFVVTDAFRLPVDGTETRVNAQDDANEFMIEYLRLCRENGFPENVVGWYHSHPGYGCWLSGIDVSTQALQQQFQDPFVAVVIDPDRTVSSNKVDIGAFRTYPEGYKAVESSGGVGPDGYQMVPLNKAEDFGAHSSRYYPLEVEHFKSSLDAKLLELLYNKYWVQTLSQNPLLTNRDFGAKQMLDLGFKIREATGALQRSSRAGQSFGASNKAFDQTLEKVLQDTKQIAGKEEAALAAGNIKAQIFQSAP